MRVLVLALVVAALAAIPFVRPFASTPSRCRGSRGSATRTNSARSVTAIRPGAISPDGRWLAYSEGRFLRVRADRRRPGCGTAAERRADSHHRVEPRQPNDPRGRIRAPVGWAVYDLRSRARAVRCGRIATRCAPASTAAHRRRRHAWSICVSRRGRPTAARSPRSSTRGRAGAVDHRRRRGVGVRRRRAAARIAFAGVDAGRQRRVRRTTRAHRA